MLWINMHKTGMATGISEYVSRQPPGSRPPLNLDVLDAYKAEEDQVIFWSTRWGCQPVTFRRRLEFLRGAVRMVPDEEIDRLVRNWGPVRRLHRLRWPLEDRIEWLDQEDAERLVNRSGSRLRIWAAQFPGLTTHSEERGTLYDRRYLLQIWRTHARAFKGEDRD